MKKLKEKFEMIFFKLMELIDKKDELLGDFVKYINDRNKKKTEKIPEQIIELAKKSIRVTTYNRELEKKIEDIRKVAYNAYEYYYDKLDTGSNLDDFEAIYKMCDEVVNKED